jgi:hypothetical protein
MKVYIVMQVDRGYGQTVEGVFLSKEAVVAYCLTHELPLGGNYWLEEHEVVK